MSSIRKIANLEAVREEQILKIMGQIDQIIDHDVDGDKSVTVVVGGTSITQSYGRSIFDDDRDSAIDKAYARANEIESNK